MQVDKTDRELRPADHPAVESTLNNNVKSPKTDKREHKALLTQRN